MAPFNKTISYKVKKNCIDKSNMVKNLTIGNFYSNNKYL